MKQIPLTMGLFALIDDDDFDKINAHKWFARKSSNTFYAATWTGDWRDRKMLHMHHLVSGTPEKGYCIDHKDGNGLNNQKANHRLCTIAQNSKNRRSYGTSRFLGVSYMKANKKWRSYIQVNGQNKYLGIFLSQHEAALAYNNAAIKYHGEFAKLNVLPDTASTVVAEYDKDVNAVIVTS